MLVSDGNVESNGPANEQIFFNCSFYFSLSPGLEYLSAMKTLLSDGDGEGGGPSHLRKCCNYAHSIGTCAMTIWVRTNENYKVISKVRL